MFKYIYEIIPFISNNIFNIDIVIPLGISFYTLKNISYIVDVYNQRRICEYNFNKYLLYSIFFPTISSGPIFRIKEFYEERRIIKENYFSVVNQSIFKISIGLFFKIVLANNLSPYVARIFDTSLPVTSINAWTSSFAYSLQIYFDFNGYTYMAIGISMLFGFNIPSNFNRPYSANSISDFWKKWHITLSLWLRDYIFLPLSYYLHRKLPIIGRKNKEMFVYTTAAILTFMICGLWHGAGWNYFLWGSLFGVFLVIERIFGLNKKLNKGKFNIIIKRLLIFLIVNLLWVLFRADLPRAMQLYKYMFTFNFFNNDILELIPQLVITALLLITLTIQYGYLDYFKNIFNKDNFYNKILYVTFMVILWTSIIILKGDSDSFIYFKF